MELPITLNLQKAAKFLEISSEGLRKKAKAGEIPGAKIGKAWIFVQEDLLKYIRSKYEDTKNINNENNNMLIERNKKLCALKKEKIPVTTMQISPSMEKDYESLLGL